MCDLFLYREGFDRGSFLSLLVLAIGVGAVGCIHFEHSLGYLLRGAAILSAAIAVSFAFRYKRFVRYRMTS